MKSSSLTLLAAAAVLVLLAPAVLARPPHRQKRVSDQRLGELEALLALKKLRGKLVTVPVAFGQINPNDYGRKRRSAPHASSSASLLERLLEAQQAQQDDLLAGLDVYDELPAALEAAPAPEPQRWAAFERERPAFNRPVTE
ncbi:UDP-N-acetylglucosamine--N-acetylmuramyl-(pentapeptide) pyrophosphoryl-undecaprenol N-acetylglucosamine transferase [Frankliniella fusca]|uniref:UDP-N-acetylglucosamine--N-acetylmuramyl-(Pentapeptide) pyrophosphoryl-undecaprenol N-acetylglucosamine transferase n=1 Tax=Frankliniella fusca TaxID=407009 RepID=A0AAE1LP04_9NEOP|nr:UDP-N-acetylglucosamine--N-acetylmuramyl-(pentapeptide) pyrophosphoryl-undecaprenol N-acetylglucosamine transferase [Frankliniella fusca]